MPRLHSRLKDLLRLAVFLVIMLPPWASGASPPPLVVVIVAQGNTIKDVSKHDLRKLFLRNSSGIDGQSLIPLNHPPKTDTRVLFDKAVLGMSEAEVGRYWVDRRVRGESGPPRTVAPPQLLQRVVSRLPGAISYVRANEIDNTVRVLTIDGKGPSHPDYPLK